METRWHLAAARLDDQRRGSANHYPIMELADICNRPVADLTTPDAVLFLWDTVPCLQQAFQVLDAWGFEYVSNYVWTKDKIGIGHWNRNQHEHLLIARRGNFPTPKPADRASSVIRAPRREHSRKPDEVYELIERMYPELPKIELFARSSREGWDQWGNEVAKFDAAIPSESAPQRESWDQMWTEPFHVPEAL